MQQYDKGGTSYICCQRYFLANGIGTRTCHRHPRLRPYVRARRAGYSNQVLQLAGLRLERNRLSQIPVLRASQIGGMRVVVGIVVVTNIK